MDLQYIEVDFDNKASLSLFRDFYYSILEPSFDKEQLETYEQLLETLSKKKTNFFGKNSYHILIFFNKDNIILGGIIYDYFINSNTGLIEYIVTSKSAKKQGIASHAFLQACKNLNVEAHQNGFNNINFICCEVEKVLSTKQSNHYFWDKFGFKRLDFDYIQPPLEEGKNMVRDMNFGIITNAENAQFSQKSISREVLTSILHDYAYYTMRIETPENEPFFIEMIEQLNQNTEQIKLV